MTNSVNYCYSCGEALTEKNSSVEHIIPNTIGGRLKSKKLICKSCNSHFGNEIDYLLGEKFNSISTALGINRDRGDLKSISGTHGDTNEQVLIHKDGTFNFAHPKIDKTVSIEGSVKTTKISIRARNVKEFNKIKSGLIDKVKAKGAINTEDSEKSQDVSPLVNVKLEFGSDAIFKAITKIALNFYLLKDGDVQQIQPIVNYLKSQELPNTTTNSYYPSNKIHLCPLNSIGHRIFLHFSQADKYVYSVVELFDIFKYFVVIQENYHGSDKILKYEYDLLNNQVVNGSFNQITSRVEASEIMKQRYFVTTKDVEERFKRILSHSKAIQFNHLKK